jgi:hypothetical protein
VTTNNHATEQFSLEDSKNKKIKGSNAVVKPVDNETANGIENSAAKCLQYDNSLRVIKGPCYTEALMPVISCKF